MKVPVSELAVRDVVVYLGRRRTVSKLAQFDWDGLSTVNFDDGRWVHCDPATLLVRL